MSDPRHSPAVVQAIKRIDALRRYPVPATAKAVRRVLDNLRLEDLVTVTSMLAERDAKNDGAQ
jgi:hypothetical protein